MLRPNPLAEAASAAEELASMLVGYDVSKAIDPTTPEGFLMVSEMVASRLASAAHINEADVINDILAELAFEWGEMSNEAIDAAIDAARVAIAEAYDLRVLPKIAEVFQIEGPSLILATRLAVIARENIQIAASLSQRDLEAELLIRRTHTNFVRHASGVRAEVLSQKARDIVAAGVAQGVSTQQIGQDLKQALSNDIPRPDSYWKVVADAFVGQGRMASQIAAYEDAGITTYEIVAVLDEVTSDICRFMDGKTFQVSAARGLLNRLNSLDNPEDIRFANPWVRSGFDDEGYRRLYVPNADGSSTTLARIERSGIGRLDDRGDYSGALSDGALAALGVPVPPFHARCRTTIVAGVE